MNSKIQELYLESHSIRHYDDDPALDGNPPTHYWQDEVSAQRFANHVLNEVFTVLGGYVDQRIPASEYVVRLKNHFGR